MLHHKALDAPAPPQCQVLPALITITFHDVMPSMSTAPSFYASSGWALAGRRTRSMLLWLGRRSTEEENSALDCVGHPSGRPQAGLRPTVEGSAALARAGCRTTSWSLRCGPAPLDKGAPGDSAEIAGEAAHCALRQAVLRSLPGVVRVSGTTPPVMSPHGIPPPDGPSQVLAL